MYVDVLTGGCACATSIKTKTHFACKLGGGDESSWSHAWFKACRTLWCVSHLDMLIMLCKAFLYWDPTREVFLEIPRVSFRSCLSSNRFCCRRNRWFCSTRTGGAITLGFPEAWSIVQATKLIIIIKISKALQFGSCFSAFVRCLVVKVLGWTVGQLRQVRTERWQVWAPGAFDSTAQKSSPWKLQDQNHRPGCVWGCLVFL